MTTHRRSSVPGKHLLLLCSNLVVSQCSGGPVVLFSDYPKIRLFSIRNNKLYSGHLTQPRLKVLVE